MGGEPNGKANGNGAGNGAEPPVIGKSKPANGSFAGQPFPPPLPGYTPPAPVVPSSGASQSSKGEGEGLKRGFSFRRTNSRKNVIAVDALSPAEERLKRAKELGMEQPFNLAEVWDVERGVKEMEAWPEKLGGYRELCFYLFFYIIFCLIQVLQCDPASAFAVNYSLTNVVSGYDTVATQQDWWAYVNTLLTNIFQAQWYNGDTFTTSETGFVQYYQKLVGGVLIYQQRGTEAPCKKSLYTTFYGNCHTDTPEVGNFTTEATFASTTYGYDSTQQGYSAFFSVALTQQQVLDQLANLEASRWLDKNTRGVTIKFAVYNGEYQLFAFAAVVMTYGIGGVMFGNNVAEIQSARFEIYKTQQDYARLVLEIIFMYMAAWLFSDEMIDLYQTVTDPVMQPNGRRQRDLLAGLKRYFSNHWNYIDLLNHGLCMTYIAERIGYVIYVYQNPIKLPTNQYQQELEVVAGLNTNLLLIISFNLFVKILHVFKYFSFQPRMNILSSTVSRALPDLFHFFILFGCVFLSYTVIAILLFGPHLQTYSSFGIVTETLGEMILGSWDYGSIHDINPLMATLMFWSYAILVAFVLVNVFLAILIDAYAAAKAQASDATGIPEDIGRMILSAFSKKPKGAKGDPLRDALRFFQDRGVSAIETEDIEWFLKQQYGITDKQFLIKNEGLLRAMQCRMDKDEPNCEMETLLQAAWKTYDADGSGFLDREEFRAFLADAPIKTSPDTAEQLDDLIKAADTNGDGLVSFDEFVPIFHAVMLESLAATAKKELKSAKENQGKITR